MRPILQTRLIGEFSNEELQDLLRQEFTIKYGLILLFDFIYVLVLLGIATLVGFPASFLLLLCLVYINHRALQLAKTNMKFIVNEINKRNVDHVVKMRQKYLRHFQ